jgi:Flp pilus assembly protein TadG
MIQLFKRFIRDFRKEDGTASIEFIFIVPMLMTIFMASCESGYFMVRHVMLERAVDMTMRDLRLGLINSPDVNKVRTLICTRAVVLKDCLAETKIEVQPFSAVTNANQPCLERAAKLDPLVEKIENKDKFERGGGNELMLVRVCVRQDAMFPTTGVGLGLDPGGRYGGYALITRSAFVNEPT